MAGLTDRIIQAESGGDPFATNSRSSAGGSGQFIDSTWLSMLNKHRPDLARGKSREELLRLKFDPAISREMTDAYAMDNQSFLKSRGIEPNDANTYLAHFAGPAGAAAIHANPGATVESLLGPAAVAANPFLKGKTGADVINWAASKASPSQMMAKSLRQRYGSEGASAAPTAVSPAAGGTGLDKLKAALGGGPAKPTGYNADRLTDSEKLIADAQGIAAKNTTLLGAIGSTALAGYGGYVRDQERGSKRKDEQTTIEALGGGSAPPAVKALLESSNPDDRAAGKEAMLKLATSKPTNKWQPTADGTIMINETTGEVRKTGADRKDQNAPGDVKTYEYDMAQRAENGQPTMPFEEWIKTHKPGSADLGAELGARIGVADMFQQKVPGLMERLGKFGSMDRFNLMRGGGEAQQLWRDIEDGREAYVRLQTGAGMSESEAKNAVKRFQIETDDLPATMQKKVQGLSEVLSAARKGAIEAKTGATARKYTADNDPAVIAKKKAAEAELAKRKTPPPVPGPGVPGNPNMPRPVPTTRIDPATGQAMPAAPAAPPAAPLAPAGPPLASRVPPGMVPPPGAGAPPPVAPPAAPPAPPPVQGAQQAAAAAGGPPAFEPQVDPSTGAPLEYQGQERAANEEPPKGNPALAHLSVEELQAIAFGAK